MAKGRERDRAIEDGFYDGRFRTKVAKDKKREQKKHQNKKYLDDLDD